MRGAQGETETGLEQGPVDDENEAEDEEGDRDVEAAVVIHHRQVAHPRLAGSYPEHAHEGPVELEELERCNTGEEVDPQDSICKSKQRRQGRWVREYCAVGTEAFSSAYLIRDKRSGLLVR
jgi:hypothetical protein